MEAMSGWFRWALCAGLAAHTVVAAAGDVELQERPDGSVVITDAPGRAAGTGEAAPADAQRDTSPAPAPTPAPAATTGQGNRAASSGGPDYQLTIRQPSADAVIWADDARLRVTVESQPELAPDHRLRVSLGDHAAATVEGAGMVELHPVHRGSYPLVAEVIGPDGTRLARTAPRMIHVKQHSRLHPGRTD